MIVKSYLKGGLGNQCFCYAAARAYALRCSGDLHLNLDILEEDHVYRRKYSLDSFSVVGKVETSVSHVRRKFEDLRFKICSRKVGSVGGYVCERRPFAYRPIPLLDKSCISLDGYWQSEKYFADFADQIRTDLALKNNSWLKNDGVAQMIFESGQSAFLHVRSYKDIPGKGDGSGALPISYYENAIRRLAAEVPSGLKVFLFSDDCDWAEERIGHILRLFNVDFIVVRPDSVVPVSAQLRDFSLMRLCRHGIVADSSFSWWAGWLGERDWSCRGEKAIRIHIDKCVLNADFWPERWASVRE